MPHSFNFIQAWLRAKTTHFNFVRTKNILEILQEWISNFSIFIGTKTYFSLLCNRHYRKQKLKIFTLIHAYIKIRENYTRFSYTWNLLYLTSLLFLSYTKALYSLSFLTERPISHNRSLLVNPNVSPIVHMHVL